MGRGIIAAAVDRPIVVGDPPADEARIGRPLAAAQGDVRLKIGTTEIGLKQITGIAEAGGTGNGGNNGNSGNGS